MQKVVTSLQNSRVKQIVKLKQRRHRDAVNETVVEGVREMTCALKNGFAPTELFICHELLGNEHLETVMTLLTTQHLTPLIYEVSAAVFAKMAYRETSGGILAVLPYWSTTLDQLPVSKRPFFVVIENVEKPGNLGAILRTADAAGVDGVIICSNQAQNAVDLYNPNVIRASLGAIFTQPTARTATADFIEWACLRQLQIVAATPDGDMPYTAVDYTQPVAIVMGSEAFGLSELLLQAATDTAVIPMQGQVDSLNLSVSTAIFLYEAQRQKQLGKSHKAI